MKNNAGKITKLLKKFDSVFSQWIEESIKKEKANYKKLEKKMNCAETLCRKALALCREDMAGNPYESDGLFIGCIFRLSDILIRRGNADEAAELLSEVCGKADSYGNSPILTRCMGHYGSILCESGMYDNAARILDDMLNRVKGEFDDGGYPKANIPDGEFALCRGLGSAARAFTYAREGDGFAPERFTLPVEILEKIAEKGADAAGENIKRAAYYAASQQLFLTCYETVPGADVREVLKYAEKCENFCDKSSGKDLYFPAATRLKALACARDCRFADAAELCRLTLDQCAGYSGEQTKDVSGSIQSIAGDMNLLLGILNYRASNISECIRCFGAAIASYEADAKGVPLSDAGYAEAETDILFMTSAEKCAFACKFTGLAKFSDNEKYPLDECVQVMRRGVELLETAGSDEPYFILAASAEYHIISQMCGRAGDSDSEKKFDEMSRSRGFCALADLRERLSDSAEYAKYYERVGCWRRMALRSGLLELYGDYTRFAILLSEPPYSQPDHRRLARLNFDMGEYSRVVGKNESAVEYYSEVRKHSFDGDGRPYYEMGEGNIFEFSLVVSASCLAKCGEMAKARRIFREYVDLHSGSDAEKSAFKVRTAGLSRDVGLDPAECAVYMREAAQAMEGEEGGSIVAAELYNQEGICWYNASPITDTDGTDEQDENEAGRLGRTFEANELQAFENALKILGKCDGKTEKEMDLKPSLHSNIGECYMRQERYDVALWHYKEAVDAFERLFASGFFIGKSKSEQEPYIFQYGLCFKTMGDIYNELNDNSNCAEALTKAIEVMEKMDNPAARNELAGCLNARGVVNFRLGDYRKNVEDATRAIAIKKGEDGGEINMAIMLKNRSDAYRELGDFRSMQSDLSESIGLLDKSKLPDELLGSFYGSHWFSMGICQEGLNKNGKAADAYRKAAGYMDKSLEIDDSGAYMKALCHFRRAVCLCRREEQEYYGALYEYDKAIKLLEKMPASDEKNENLRQLLTSRGSLYEAFREIDLARADFVRAESLRTSGAQSE